MSLLSRLAVQAARAYGILSARNTNISASYLVVAGGGGGTQGGGGAGGLLTSTFTLSTLNTYSITVGAGGNGVLGDPVTGGAGGNSSISGTGLSTITATGGGGGAGGGTATPGNGGSGGGAQSYNISVKPGGTGISGQGNNGGSNDTPAPYAAGGGGGAGAVGGNGSGSTGGAGGAGLSSSISGSSVTYAGGGGGGTYSTGTGGAGGSGGGGAGSGNITVGTAGTPNTGGGGGGSGQNYSGGNGGSGIVIISYASATPKFVGGTLTTSGGNQIHTFTSSGTLSPLTPVTASYLVVAGGGGGGGYGAGGAGGLLTGSTTIYAGATYVVTVGAGGAGGNAATNVRGSSGSNTVLSGTGLTTFTCIGGGGGGADIAGGSGGSGGGGGVPGSSGAGGAGTSGQGNNGGNGTGSGGTSGGGGGGAGGVGGNASGGTGGAGGLGVSSSITGTSLFYAGGGGGGGSTTGASGGSGVGGNGSSASLNNNTSGTPFTGSGGGGGRDNRGSDGNSGTVIISYAGSQQFNGGLVTSSGGNTIHTFTATGALTPLTNNLNNSLRFRGSASAYLNRTPSVASNRKTWTWSAWIKLGTISVNMGTLFGAQGQTAIYLNDGTNYSFRVNGAAGSDLITNLMPRDPAAWYHLVVACDTTQATEANRLKIYVNGNQQTSFQAGSAYPTLNGDTYFNSTALHTIGRRSWNSDQQFDGYMTDINFIDGQALEPYYFGNNDANGVWKPIQYKGTYGTNGFYLTFGNTTSTTTLGYDSSPNGNNWTTNNISLTAGTTYDAMLDVPTNTSATVANYSTLNPTQTATANITWANANLQASLGTTAAWRTAISTIAVDSGKWYAEFYVTTGVANNSAVGILPITDTYSGSYLPGSTSGSYGYPNDGTKYNNGSNTSYGNSWTTGDIIGIAYDGTNNKIWFSKNGTWQASGDPVAGTNAAFTTNSGTSYYFAVAGAGATQSVFNCNFGQRPFSYTPPTGYVALNTYNLPTPTILQGNKYMDATLYTGNGSTQTVTNATGFKPDLVWVKNRGEAHSHQLFDSVRGVGSGLGLKSNASDEEGLYGSQYGWVSAINSNGFSVEKGSDIAYFVNNNAIAYVGWQWQAGQSSGSSNTSGSITSTVSASTTAGFSVVQFTGTGANATVGHGLGVAPKMIILKRRNFATGWFVYHSSLSNTQFLRLQGTDAATTGTGVWNSTSPTSTVFSIGNDGNVNASGQTYINYCWAEIAGFSKFGSYTGNASTDGPFVYTGFRPKYVMIKRTDATGSWRVWDTSRSTYNVSAATLIPNATNAELTTSNENFDILSNGFKLRNVDSDQNASGGTYIYAAFAENPFKNSNAR